MTLFTRKAVLAAKVEATPGTLETLTVAEAAYNVMNPELSPTIDVSTRPIQGSFRKLPGVPGQRLGTCSFSIEAVGTGAGGVPSWATVFLAACGVVNAAGTLTPREEAPGANVKTLSLALYEDGRVKRLRGAVGTFTVDVTPGTAVMFNFTFTGVYDSIADTALLAPTYPTLAPLRAASGAVTINSIAQVFGTCTFDIGNTVVIRPSITNLQGASFGIITDRTPTITIDPESKLLATENVWADWEGATTRAFSLAFQDAADKITIAAPAVQRMTVANGDREGLRLDTQTLQCCRSGTSAEFSIVFAAP
jgi:hypothetical protein